MKRTRPRTCVATLAVASLVATLAAGGLPNIALGSTRQWTIDKSPNTSLPGGSFESVGCSSGRACTAVGTYLSLSGLTATLAERWNGVTWKRQAIPNLPGVRPSVVPRLVSVSCPSAQFCAAVGGTGTISAPATRPGAETWNGSSWKVRPVSLPSDATGARFNQISCLSATFCEAVGSSDSGTTEATLAEVWRGTRWRVQRAPSPVGETGGTLTGVSCVSSSFCEAVGRNETTGAAFAERYNGTSWHLQSLPAAIGVDAVVSCASEKFCEAVDTSAAVWNGTSWHGQSVPTPTGASYIFLTGVSCVSARFCDAVGSSSNGIADVAWHGRSWRSQPVPGHLGASFLTKLSGIACTAADRCETAGQVALPPAVVTLPLAANWNGRSWRTQHPRAPAEAIDNSLSAVSCVSAGFCEAAGSTADSAGNQLALAERWNGTSWTIQAIPNPLRGVGGVRQELDGLSCVSLKFCAAVGESSATPGLGQTPGAGAAAWNGRSWRALTIPGSYALASVSCVSTRFCVAVGGLAETDMWNGRFWSSQPSVAGFVLNSVSCVSTRFCEAVGSEAGAANAEVWNGSKWSALPNPATPLGGRSIILNAVSCTAKDSCEVVGNTLTDPTTGVADAVLELWNGTWVVQKGPADPKATGSYLNAVSCASASSCTAVGVYTFGTPPLPGAPLPGRTLAQVWNGKSWTLRSTPNPSPTQDALTSVSCAVSHTCTSVGWAADLGGFQATLVEVGD